MNFQKHNSESSNFGNALSRPSVHPDRLGPDQCDKGKWRNAPARLLICSPTCPLSSPLISSPSLLRTVSSYNTRCWSLEWSMLAFGSPPSRLFALPLSLTSMAPGEEGDGGSFRRAAPSLPPSSPPPSSTLWPPCHWRWWLWHSFQRDRWVLLWIGPFLLLPLV